ncbi:hypothetical protein QBC38DRAFT_22677 [Podospora fimiseda]|uniref:Uncharacterized protein n=1 Tax=Podospora fimiseda TaxID=252190 RepID=A0AAN7H0E5_9PEZI|nr:hypothetical protein QBC38DRAFT_22677 [Podospora fimiseda]
MHALGYHLQVRITCYTMHAEIVCLFCLLQPHGGLIIGCWSRSVSIRSHDVKRLWKFLVVLVNFFGPCCPPNLFGLKSGLQQNTECRCQGVTNVSWKVFFSSSSNSYACGVSHHSSHGRLGKPGRWKRNYVRSSGFFFLLVSRHRHSTRSRILVGFLIFFSFLFFLVSGRTRLHLSFASSWRSDRAEHPPRMLYIDREEWCLAVFYLLPRKTP